MATFTTDAALKSAVGRDFPNVATRKCNEWNEWQLQAICTGGRANWLDMGADVLVDCGHDKEAQKGGREGAYNEARTLQKHYDNGEFSARV